MSCPPRDSREGVFAGGMFFDITYQGILVLTTALLEVPFLAKVFGFLPLGLTGYAIDLAFLVIPVVELVELTQRRLHK